MPGFFSCHLHFLLFVYYLSFTYLSRATLPNICIHIMKSEIFTFSDSEFLEKSQEFRRQFNGRIGENVNVFTAIDTRPSSKYIEEAAFHGMQCARVRSRRLGD